MANMTKFNSFLEALAKKLHKLDTSGNGGDQLVIALCASANAPVATNSVLANLTQIAYTNLSTRNLVVSSSGQSSGTYKLCITDLVLTATGNVATFRYVVIYNDTAGNKELIGWYDYGTDVTLVSGDTFTINFDDANGVFQIT